MSSCRQQALIDAPLEAVWELVGDPRLAAHAINVTLGKRWYRRSLENALDGVRSAARRERADRPG